MADINRRRRYYLLARQFYANVVIETITAGALRYKQEAEPGVALPADFPFLSKISAANVGYTTIEDLDGADEDELTAVGLTPREARAVLTRLQTLL